MDDPYTAKDIKMALHIGDSTLRKWCIAIEKAGYFFNRTDKDRRVFFDHDLIVLRHFQNLVQVQRLSLQNAGIVIASKFDNVPFEQKNSKNNVPAMRADEETTKKLFDEIEQLKDFNRHLIKRLDEQQDYIEERLKSRDRAIMERLDSAMEQQRQLAAAKEEEPKKSFLTRLFGK